ncbi:hypothetical protein GCM10027442_06520 [Emticicia fontis]
MLANPDGSTNPSGSNGNPSNPNNPNNPNNNTPKCYVSEIKNTEDGVSYNTKFTYNAKNLLELKDEDGFTTKYEYDANSRITKMIMTDDFAETVETFSYEYDSKGNMSKVKYDAEGGMVELLLTEYVYTTNAKGQVEKIQAMSPDGPIDFVFEYDAKSNIKKISAAAGPQKLTLIENFKFDDKSNVYVNTNLSKAYLPHILVSTIFGFNMTYLFNPNNILSDSAISMFTGETETATYDYGYTAEGFPSKMTAVRKYAGDTTKEEETYTYSCK